MRKRLAVEGTEGNDKLIGGIGRDTLDRGSAKDKVFGGGGPDTLIGGSKKDAVRGQNGTDTCDLDFLDVFSTCEAGEIGQTGSADEVFSAAGDVNQLTGTTDHGVRIVAVDAFDWTLSLSAVG